MKKVKIFTHETTSILQKEINEFIEKNFIKDFTLTSITNTDGYFSVIMIYETKK